MPTQRNRTFVLAAGLLVIGTAVHAGVPDPRFSVIEPHLVGNSTGTLMLNGLPGDQPGFEVTLRDVNNAPIPNVAVTLDFSNAPTLHLYSSQNGGTTVNCAARTLSRMTDAQGKVAFGARFGGYSNTAAVEVDSAGTNLLTTVPARSTDLDGAGGRTDANDLNLFRSALFGAFRPECDFTVDGAVNAADLVLFKNEIFSGEVQTYCP